MKLLILILIPFLIIACATTGKLEDKMQTRIGMNVNSLIDEIGPPSSSFQKPDGDIMYTWHNDGGSNSRTISSYSGYKTYATTNYYCDVTYITGKDQIIKSWQHQGNNCKSH